jgi:hypothetical protein
VIKQCSSFAILNPQSQYSFLCKILSNVAHLCYIENQQYNRDFCACFCSKSLIAIGRQIQQCLNSIQKWADENGFKFSKSKTVHMHFSQLHSINVDPDLKLYGERIPVVNEFKFLELIFDKKLTFKQHIKYLKDRCMNWVANFATLLKLYCSHVRLKLDHGYFCHNMTGLPEFLLTDLK